VNFVTCRPFGFCYGWTVLLLSLLRCALLHNNRIEQQYGGNLRVHIFFEVEALLEFAGPDRSPHCCIAAPTMRPLIINWRPSGLGSSTKRGETFLFEIVLEESSDELYYPILDTTIVFCLDPL
jgi:hypothetical protein